jgi:hypothetical protein
MPFPNPCFNIHAFVSDRHDRHSSTLLETKPSGIVSIGSWTNAILKESIAGRILRNETDQK